MALGLKHSGKKARVYLIIGDGEAQEGQVWEMALFAAQKKLSNLILFLDFNKRQLDGRTETIADLEDPTEKFKSFAWHAVRIPGNDPDRIARTVREVQAAQGEKPGAIILDTEKGAGVQKIIDIELNHHITCSPELADAVISELEAQKKG